jgi:hypothetical protein
MQLRAGEKSDELATFHHSIPSSARASSGRRSLSAGLVHLVERPYVVDRIT